MKWMKTIGEKNLTANRQKRLFFTVSSQKCRLIVSRNFNCAFMVFQLTRVPDENIVHSIVKRILVFKR